MKSFDLHFGLDGRVQVDNIKGVMGNECQALTHDYLAKMEVKESIYIGSEGFEKVQENLDERL